MLVFEEDAIGKSLNTPLCELQILSPFQNALQGLCVILSYRAFGGTCRSYFSPLKYTEEV